MRRVEPHIARTSMGAPGRLPPPHLENNDTERPRMGAEGHEARKRLWYAATRHHAMVYAWGAGTQAGVVRKAGALAKSYAQVC